MLPTKTWSRPEKEKKKRRTISRGLAPFACHSKSTDDILCRQALNFRTLDVPAHLEVTSDTGWKLFTMACRRANMIVFGCEVESFGEKRVLCGECYWCCNSMEVFFFLLDYRNFYKGFWNIARWIWNMSGVLGNKRDCWPFTFRTKQEVSVTKCGLSRKPQELNELIVCLSVLCYRIV